MKRICISIFSLFFFLNVNAQLIYTIAGDGTAGYGGNGGPAILSKLSSPSGMAFDTSGNLFFCEAGLQRIMKITPSGKIIRVAGNGVFGLAGNGDTALKTPLGNPLQLAFDPAGNLFFSDRYTTRILKIDHSGLIQIVAGGMNPGTNNGVLATSSRLSFTSPLAFDKTGRLYFADYSMGKSLLYMINSGGYLYIVGGNSPFNNSYGNGGPDTTASLGDVEGLAFDSIGNLMVSGTSYGSVRKINSSSIIDSFSSVPTCPNTLTYDKNWNLYVAGWCGGSVSSADNAIYKIDKTGLVTQVVGAGPSGYSGDGGPASMAKIYKPYGIAFDAFGNLYFSDMGNNRIRKVMLCNVPGISLQPVSDTVCDAGNVCFSLQACRATAFQWQVDVGSGFVNLADTGKYNNSQTASLLISNVNVSMSGYGYRCLVTDTVLYTSSTATLTVKPTPVSLNLAAKSLLICGSYKDTLSVSASGGMGQYLYYWNASLAGVSSNTTTVSPPATPGDTPATPYKYFVKVSDENGCSAVDTVTIYVRPPVVKIIASDSVVCLAGTADTLTAINAVSYKWFNDSTQQSIVVNPMYSTYYSLVAVDSSGCSDTTSIFISIHPPIYLSVNSGLICGNIYSDTLRVSGAANYTWTPSTGLSTTSGSVVVASPIATTIYTVTGSPANCSLIGSATSTVTIDKSVVHASTLDTLVCTGGMSILTAIDTAAVGSINYYWSNGSFGSTAYVSSNSTTTYTVTSFDSQGCVAKDTITVHTMTGCIWPGDANEDLIVDNTDLLPIGIKYGATGPARAMPSISWNGYTGLNWNDTLANGVDIKYVNCNGDTIINMDDTLAVTYNYAQNHPARAQNQIVASSNPEIFFNFNKPLYNSGDTVIADIFIGTSINPQSNFYGTAFTFQYDNTLSKPGTEQFYFYNSWLGSIDTTMIKFSYSDYSGTISASAVRINHQNVSGFGKIARLQFYLKDSLAPAQIYFSFVHAIKTDKQGLMTSLTTGLDSASINAVAKINSPIANYLKIYPNPADNTIEVSLEKILGDVSIYTSLGQIVFEMSSKNKVERIDISKLEEGIYFLQIKNSEGISSKKVIVQR
jgi:sugar lactone lactonase YvrE